MINFIDKKIRILPRVVLVAKILDGSFSRHNRELKKKGEIAPNVKKKRGSVKTQ